MLRARGRLASMYMPPRMAPVPFSLRRGAWGTAPGFAPWRAIHHSEPAATLAAAPGRRRRSQQPFKTRLVGPPAPT